MNKYFKALLLVPVLLIWFSACKREPLQPVNFLEQQDLTDPQAVRPADSDTANSPVYFDANNAEATDDGYHYKGTLYFKNQDSLNEYGADNTEGSYAAATGDFNIDVNPDGSIKTITGQGSPVFPQEFSLFNLSDIEQMLYVNVGYDKGSYIKQDPDYSDFPLQDDIYYLHFGMKNLLGQYGTGELNLGNTGFAFKSVFIDPLDPMFLLWGDLSFRSKTKEYSLADMVFGMSASGQLQFEPQDFPHLTDVLGDLDFEPFTGQFYLAGVIPLDKFAKDIPLEIHGQAVIRTSDPSGQDFLVNGPDASFILGVNGQLILTHELLSYLPEDLSVQMGRATVEYYAESSQPHVTMAGQLDNQMESDGALAQMLGPYILAVLDLQSPEAYVYSNYVSTDDYMFYFEISTGIKIPGYGKITGLDGTFAFSPDSVMFSSVFTFNYGFSNVELSGLLDLNTGDFDLKGTTSTNIDIMGVHLAGYELGVEISTEIQGVRVWGDVNLGFGIADVYVEGLISADELRLEGIVNSDISFGDLSLFAFNLDVLISSKSGVELTSTLDLPYGIGHVDVEGKITSDELYLAGNLSSDAQIDFAGLQVPTFDLSVSASTKDGVFINSEVSLPYGIGDAKVSGELTSEKLKLTGQLTSKLEFAGFTLSDINLYAMLSTDPAEGVELRGDVLLLGGLGQAHVAGKINSDELYLAGSLASDLDLGFTSFHSDINVELSSKRGIDFDGNVDMPFGIGGISVDGYMHSDGNFKFAGSAKLRIDFTDDVYVEAGLSTAIRNTSVSFNAYGLAHLPVVGDVSVGVDIDVDWANMEMTFTIHTSVGDFSVTVDKDGKNVETGKQAVYRLD